MDVEEQNFVNFLEKAIKNDLSFVIIGGLALLLHGIARHTQDVDIWIEPSESSKNKFIQTLLDIGYSNEEISQGTNYDVRFTNYKYFNISSL
jgi:hypothetical protein